jgi:sugar lactone lactonase YvrE
MKATIITPLIALAVMLVGTVTDPALAQEARPPQLQEVAASTRQWTGIAISRDNKIFVSYPRWTKGLPYSVAQLDSSGTPIPYPDRDWNSWTGIENPTKHFVAVQSVYVDSKNHLWVLDTGNPEFAGVIPNAAKLVEIDPAGPTVVRTVLFPPTVARHDSYLNDVRVDRRTDTAFITDSGNGALVIVYLTSGRFRRVLDDHPATHGEAGLTVTIGETPWLRGGKAPVVHADGIALDPTGKTLYFQALTGKTLYRIGTEVLRDPTLDDAAIAEKLEVVAEVGPSDGLLMEADATLLLTSLEKNAISALSPEGKLTIRITDPAIAWPDSLASDGKGSFYFTTSRIHEGNAPTTVYKIFKVTP